MFQIAVDERIRKRIIGKWHAQYVRGLVNTSEYWNRGIKIYQKRI